MPTPCWSQNLAQPVHFSLEKSESPVHINKSWEKNSVKPWMAVMLWMESTILDYLAEDQDILLLITQIHLLTEELEMEVGQVVCWGPEEIPKQTLVSWTFLMSLFFKNIDNWSIVILVQTPEYLMIRATCFYNYFQHSSVNFQHSQKLSNFSKISTEKIMWNDSTQLTIFTTKNLNMGTTSSMLQSLEWQILILNFY